MHDSHTFGSHPTAERRLVLRMMNRWNQFRGEREHPSPDSVDWEEIGPDTPSCFLVEVASPSGASRLSFIGAEVPGSNFVSPGTRIDEIPSEMLLRRALKSFDHVISKQVPVSLGGETEAEGTPMLHRNVLLPLSRDGRHVDQVLGAITAKATDKR